MVMSPSEPLPCSLESSTPSCSALRLAARVAGTSPEPPWSPRASRPPWSVVTPATSPALRGASPAPPPVPPFEQARAFWYQWLVCLEEGARAVAADPVGFARIQWDTWSPAGWFDHDEFKKTARSFANPDWVAITLHAYRSRFLEGEVRDARYE